MRKKGKYSRENSYKQILTTALCAALTLFVLAAATVAWMSNNRVVTSHGASVNPDRPMSIERITAYRWDKAGSGTVATQVTKNAHDRYSLNALSIPLDQETATRGLLIQVILNDVNQNGFTFQLSTKREDTSDAALWASDYLNMSYYYTTDVAASVADIRGLFAAGTAVTSASYDTVYNVQVESSADRAAFYILLDYKAAAAADAIERNGNWIFDRADSQSGMYVTIPLTNDLDTFVLQEITTP